MYQQNKNESKQKLWDYEWPIQKQERKIQDIPNKQQIKQVKTNNTHTTNKQTQKETINNARIQEMKENGSRDCCRILKKQKKR